MDKRQRFRRVTDTAVVAWEWLAGALLPGQHAEWVQPTLHEPPQPRSGPHPAPQTRTANQEVALRTQTSYNKPRRHSAGTPLSHHIPGRDLPEEQPSHEVVVFCPFSTVTPSFSDKAPSRTVSGSVTTTRPRPSCR